ncbi:MAG: amidohydrolase [Euryarchaeota archaeon]|nr:amidohydrolase [Euryarchaeota archaeon]
MPSQPRADLILYNGTVFTVDAKATEAQAVAVADGRVIAVGKDRTIKAMAVPKAKRIDLKGRFLLPGFIDAHTHLAKYGVLLSQVPLGQARSVEDVVRRLAAASCKAPPGDWVVGYGWDETNWTVARYLTREDLDKASSTHPILASRVDRHMAAVNSTALRRLALPAGLHGVEEMAGTATGVLKESAWDAARRLVEPEGTDAGTFLDAGIKEAASLGVTSVHNLDCANDLAAYGAAENASRIRAYLMHGAAQMEALTSLGVTRGVGSEFLRLGGVKFYVDGSIGARTAALRNDYDDAPGVRGELTYRSDELAEWFANCDRAGLQIAAHAIGDDGIEQALDAFDDADVSTEARHRLEHFEMASIEQMRRAVSMGILLSMQPNFTGEWGRPGGMYERRVGKRASTMNALRTAVDEGATLAFGSDHMPFGPLYGLHWAVNAPFDCQRISVEEALQAYTIGGAFASFEEMSKGSIEPGKAADLVVLGKDPRDEPENIDAITVEMTVVAGAVTFKR